MRTLALAALALILPGGMGFYALTLPDRLPDAATAGLTGDAARGEAVFWAAGCASCHAAEGASGDDLLVLAGGQRFVTGFGTFVAPNISPDPTHGIGGWSLADLANAMQRGVSPEGRHYYPAFPYTAYAKAEVQDIADLKVFLDTLPAASSPSQPHDLSFPFTLRRGIGLWKRLYLSPDWVIAGALPPDAARGRYLAEALGHCAECHTPRDALGGLRTGAWLAGAPNPSGQGQIPGISSATLDWTEADIASYLTTGFTPDYDSAGGHMAKVVENLARLPAADVAAIASYLKQVP